MRPSLRRALIHSLTVALFAAAALTTNVSPAAAGTIYRTIHSSSWAYVDASRPDSSFVDQSGDAPVGAWHDDATGHHISRSYFALDLAPFLGKRIFSAIMFGRETVAEDCDKRAVELWSTDDFDARTTWRDKPVERTKLGFMGPIDGYACPAPRLEFDLTHAVAEALAAGRSRLTVALRVPDGEESSLVRGRHFASSVGVTVAYNTPPDTPTNLRTAHPDNVCATQAPGPYLNGGTHNLYAYVQDPDGTVNLDARFAVWPVDAPDERREFLSVSGSPNAWAPLPSELPVNGRTYAWQVQADDGDDASPWSQTCYFTYDTDRPATAPMVSSVDYPENEWGGGAGIPGTFTFSAAGDTDVIGFHYRDWLGVTNYVAANHAGGSAEVDITPERSGFSAIYVVGVDKAGNRSPERAYEFRVIDTAPIVTGPRTSPFGVPAEFTFSPRMPDGVEYLYWFDSGEPTVVVADSDGTARVSVSKPVGVYLLHVRSRTSAGLLSSVYTTVFAVVDEPVVTSDVYPELEYGGGVGTSGTFTFAPSRPDVTEYVYRFDSQPETTVAAGADSKATVTWTPTIAHQHTLTVYSRSGDDAVSESRTYTFYVNAS